MYTIIAYVNKREKDAIINKSQKVKYAAALEKLIREDTILVSICAVNSETGLKAPLKTIRQIINKKNKKTIFHSDMTQALGKIKVNLSDVDLASFSSHKIYAPKGIGMLYKKNTIEIEPDRKSVV